MIGKVRGSEVREVSEVSKISSIEFEGIGFNAIFIPPFLFNQTPEVDWILNCALPPHNCSPPGERVIFHL